MSSSTNIKSLYELSMKYRATVAKNPEKEIAKRSIIIGGINKDIPLNAIINAFSQTTLTGGGPVQNFEFYDSDKIRITYHDKRDVERVIARGPTQKIANHVLQVSRLNVSSVETDKMKYLPAIVEKDSVSSSDISCSGMLLKESKAAAAAAMAAALVSSVTTTATIGANSTVETFSSTTPVSFRNKFERLDYDLLTDKRRILLLNVPDDIDYDYLELYLEYLSDECEVECIDYAREMQNSIVATFVREIDFERIRAKHERKPYLLKHSTSVQPVFLPTKIVIEPLPQQYQSSNASSNNRHNSSKSDTKSPSTRHQSCSVGSGRKIKLDEHFTPDMLEIYFSNKKRSGGRNVKGVEFDVKNNRAFVTFENYDVANQVASRTHQINKIDLGVKLYYEKIGPDPFFKELKISRLKDSLEDMIIKRSTRQEAEKTTTSEYQSQYQQHKQQRSECDTPTPAPVRTMTPMPQMNIYTPSHIYTSIPVSIATSNNNNTPTPTPTPTAKMHTPREIHYASLPTAMRSTTPAQNRSTTPALPTTTSQHRPTTPASTQTPTPTQQAQQQMTRLLGLDEFEAKKKTAQQLLNQLTADKMEKRFDVNNLSAQQAECIIQLQSLYAELNNAAALAVAAVAAAAVNMQDNLSKPSTPVPPTSYANHRTNHNPNHKTGPPQFDNVSDNTSTTEYLADANRNYRHVENLDCAQLLLNQFDALGNNDGQTITTNSSAYDEVIEKLVDLDKLEAPCIRKHHNSRRHRSRLDEPMPNQHIYMSGGQMEAERTKASSVPAGGSSKQEAESLHTINSLSFTQSSMNTDMIRHTTQNDLLKKSAVNLPRLDEPLLTFEEYSILNNINQSLKQLIMKETYGKKKDTGNSSGGENSERDETSNATTTTTVANDTSSKEYSSQQQIFSYYHFHAHQQQQLQQQQHQQQQFQIGQHNLPQIRHQQQQRQKHHAQKETTVRRRPVSAAAVVESAPTPTSRRPVVIHGGKERPPAPKIIKIAPHPRPQSISAGISISTTPIVLSAMITPNNKPTKTTIAQLFSQQQLQQQQQQQQPPKLNATQRRSESVQSKQPTVVVGQKTVTPQPTNQTQTQSKPRPQETQIKTPQQVVKKLSVGAPTLTTTTTSNPVTTTTTPSETKTLTTKPTPTKAPTPTPSMTTTTTTKSQTTKKPSSTNTNTPISTNTKPTPIKTASIKPAITTTKTTTAAAMAMIPANQNVCRYFTEDVSVSETTDITDVTAKSHSINSYSTSLQAEIGSGCQGHFGANNSNAAAAAYRYHRHHLNLDTINRPRPESVFANLIKNSLAKNHIKLQYGPVTTAESITHLEAHKIDFLKQTTYLQDLTQVYPKISVNLNEPGKRVYIFGAASQVSECKQKIKDDLNRVNNKEFRLENREVATYLVEKDVKEKILKHVYNHFKKLATKAASASNNNNTTTASSSTETELNAASLRHFYANYDVIDHSSRNPKDLGEYSLIVYTNCDRTYEYIFNYLSESIYVDYELKIRSDEFAHLVVANDSRWAEFYRRASTLTQQSNNNSSSSDGATKTNKFVVYRMDSKKSKKKNRSLRWYLKLTGFKSSCEEFLTELIAHFGNVFE